MKKAKTGWIGMWRNKTYICADASKDVGTHKQRAASIRCSASEGFCSTRALKLQKPTLENFLPFQMRISMGSKLESSEADMEPKSRLKR
jgi:hypothetical protein